jgi:alcohol dehydrogenase class IV
LSKNARSAVHNDDLEAPENVLLGTLFGGIATVTSGSNLYHATSCPVTNNDIPIMGNDYRTHAREYAGLPLGSDSERYTRVPKLLGVETDRLNARDAVDDAKETYIQLYRDLKSF